MTNLTYDTLLMLDNKSNKDETEGWEKSIDEDSVPKLKHPVFFKDSILSGIQEPENAVFSSPKGKESVKTKTLDLGKRGSKSNNKKGLF